MFATCLLAICASSTVQAATPDWPKSLTLGTDQSGAEADAPEPVLDSDH